MLTKISNILAWFSENFKVVAVFIIGICTAFILLQHNKIKSINKEVERLSNNIEYYQNIQDTLSNNNRLLRLTINEFSNSRDSVIAQLNETRKELGIKDRQLVQAQSQKQQIIVDTTVIVKDNNFIKEIKPNELTSIIIAKTDSILTAKLSIENTQTLFISSKKQYKNQYKSWLKRLIKFDFKKQTVYNYSIQNSNDIIKITDTRLVTVE